MHGFEGVRPSGPGFGLLERRIARQTHKGSPARPMRSDAADEAPSITRHSRSETPAAERAQGRIGPDAPERPERANPARAAPRFAHESRTAQPGGRTKAPVV